MDEKAQRAALPEQQALPEQRSLSRTAIGVGILALIGGLAWTTMEAGRMRTLVMVVLCGFALRLLLLSRGSRYDKAEEPDA